MEELKNEIIEQETVQEEPYKSGSVHYIDSREVAKLVGKDHDKLRRDIRRYTEHLDSANFGDISKFWMESIYADTYGRTQKCYLITEKGCEFIAHKLTGQKGSEFTARYIDRFHEMKGELEGQANSTIRKFIEQQMETNHIQAEFNKKVMEFMSAKQDNLSLGSGVNPFDPGEDVIKERMAKLNGLIDQTSELCGLERNKTLHYMYQTLQEDMGVNLKSYLNVFRSEMQDERLCNLHVICNIDRFYNAAVEMNENVIGRKRIYG